MLARSRNTLSSTNILMAGYADPAPIRSDMRVAPRKIVNLPGQLKVSDYFDPLPCKIVNFSAAGARVMLPNDLSNAQGKYARLPRELTLVSVMDRTEVACRVVWKLDNQIGLRFAATPRPRA